MFHPIIKIDSHITNYSHEKYSSVDDKFHPKVNFNNVTNFIHPKDSPISLCVCVPNSIFLTNIIHLGEHVT